MKPEELYQHLKTLAEKLDIRVSEYSFRNIGLNVESGLCKVKGRKFFIMDKHLPIPRKNRELAVCLKKMPCEEIYIVPAVREYIDEAFVQERG